MGKKRIIYVSVLLILMALLYMETVRTRAGKVLGEADSFIIGVVQNPESPALTEAAILITEAGSVTALTVIALLGGIFFAWQGKWKMALFYPAAAGAGGLVNWLLKVSFQRARPDMNPLITAEGFSFPSGHSMGSMMTYGLLAYFIVRIADKTPVRVTAFTAAAALIFIIGMTRIYLGVHYPTDVAAGFLAGGIWIVIAVFIWKRWFEKRKQGEEKG
ncbi:phosphatase PAP2 family protein [Alteribacter natronophilus]|uniref:phosphatase PAP2 family protein n=1 Tax=Alteribacter natronophilus TaxID=2583810 RepID=UPI00110E2020|nr:phosphatase PAP2 family protein [Alteribacter natronophilus]TMW72047.1 phosphatase PAP2 family protein [Alteribacter natronophilus]